ncbi:transcription-repair coupling factor [Pelagibius litoralis]|uniref:Transcription-repair-coupling factor n=1 Tax=Pelagibius litoralis TaxID=374515 RepID=A0A967C3K0_9PROT|nr:transcription-repair coupling factor [Pelagibius litoralis]NIA67620.1 transcription-repair coupling factor [Pelagibius litoralis]
MSDPVSALAPTDDTASPRPTIASAAPGTDALYLARLLEEGPGGRWLHVARDDAQAARMVDSLRFFAPDVEPLVFPAWDCLPYDRVSPHRDIVARRLDVLTRLMQPAGPRPQVVVTTVNALLQRVPPPEALEGRVLALKAGDSLPAEKLNGFFAENGYYRVETVSEPGEFAVRGGIVDVFAPGQAQPLRLDFFGDDLESLRLFDPLTQRTTEAADQAILKPVSEVILDPEAVERFRTVYRSSFGAVRDDPLYEAVSAARAHPGMEHWLPLYHKRLVTLFDYLPEAGVTLDYQASEVREARLETILDFHDARKRLEGGGETGGWVYKAIEPALLYLDGPEWDRGLAPRSGGQFTPFAAPEGATVRDAGALPGLDFAEQRAAGQGNLYEAVGGRIRQQQKAGRKIVLTAFSAGALDRLSVLLREHASLEVQSVDAWSAVADLPSGHVGLAVLEIEKGFRLGDVLFLTEQDILGERIARATGRKRRAENFLTEISDLQEKDLVVHVDHGIGRYVGLETLDVGGAPHDCLKVIYHGGDKLFVPVENIEVLSRFGADNETTELDRLGGVGWQTRKARVKERIAAMAHALIELAAARALKGAEAMDKPDGLYDEFCARFPFPETDDQLRAIEETLADMAAGKPMDRLVCGDVGFGKTEVALRAAFLAVMAGKQVAVVVPTTLLCRQHYRTFKDRFAGLPVQIRQLSRLVGAKDANETKAELAKGRVEIVVGTHAVLAKSMAFKDLGLLIIDEEQHFGVKQKERLKALRADVHVLTLTATPIPRTLQMAMSGVKEMSMIATPPVDRLAVRTFVLPYDPVIVREAILREHYRGGQSFYVCPRVKDLAELHERLEKLVPEVKLAVAHGQMPPTQLEAVMTDFYDRKYDILLSTNIVESGLDIPTANTMIIHRADMFGLAQLYQLRGRIGRAKVRAYAYLTLPPGRILSAAAEKRLNVMQTLDSLGAGFQLASHDLDIRGAGNLLGEEQSGQIREVGVELYQQMLEEAVATARSGATAAEAEASESYTPQINIGMPVLIPESYVTDLSLRLGLYRRLSTLVDRAEIDSFAAELVDRFGSLPVEVENLLQIMTIKRLCRDAGVERLDAGPKGATVTFHNDSFANPAGLIAFIQQEAGKVTLRPDHTLVYRRSWDNDAARVKGVRMMLDGLVKLAA